MIVPYLNLRTKELVIIAGYIPVLECGGQAGK